MCGRYNIITDAQGLIDAFEILQEDLQISLPFTPRYNISPSTKKLLTRIPVVRIVDGRRVLQSLVWPLIPFWAKGELPKYNTANAKGETVDKTASYRGPWRRGQRLLIPATGFYEWQTIAGQKHKQPYHIHFDDDRVFAFAGLWDRSVNEDGETVESCTIIVTQANKLIAPIHNRMPVIIPPEAYEDWLTGDTEVARKLIEPYSGTSMSTVPITPYINNPQNDDHRCLEPSIR